MWIPGVAAQSPIAKDAEHRVAIRAWDAICGGLGIGAQLRPLPPHPSRVRVQSTHLELLAERVQQVRFLNSQGLSFPICIVGPISGVPKPPSEGFWREFMSSEDMHLCCSLQPMRMRLITRETGVGKRPVFCRKMPPLLLAWAFPSVTGLVQRTPTVESLLGSSRGFHVTPGTLQS